MDAILMKWMLFYCYSWHYFITILDTTLLSFDQVMTATAEFDTNGNAQKLASAKAQLAGKFILF